MELSLDKWDRVLKHVQTKLGQEVFNSWFGRLKLETTAGGVALHSVPTAFLKTWITSHYRETLLELWQKEDASILRVDIAVRSAVRHHVVEQQKTKKASENESQPLWSGSNF